ncbi:hypothetical protein [Streptomyces sp. NPDC002540]
MLPVPLRLPALPGTVAVVEVPGPGGEIAGLRRRIGELGREQEAPARRFDALTSRLPETGWVVPAG